MHIPQYASCTAQCASRGAACAGCDPCPVVAAHGRNPQYGMSVDDWRVDTAGARASAVGERARTAIDRREAGAVGRGLRPARRPRRARAREREDWSDTRTRVAGGADTLPLSHHMASAARTQPAGRWNTLLMPPAHMQQQPHHAASRAHAGASGRAQDASDREAARAASRITRTLPAVPCVEDGAR